MPATGTIAAPSPTSARVRTSPVAGMVHALAVLTAMLVAAPLALHVPLAALAGCCLFVAFNMGEWHEFAPAALHRAVPHLLVGTFVMTIVFDLTVAVEPVS